ncbi:MAG: VCBS repeat-containing protein, partial [Nostocaceae cyanobacterium CSU_2_110]|nr:VCBS repeat-containing protein [Nostocaceae cyanobacterium CSU_2_110]
MLESTNPLQDKSTLQSATIQNNSFAPETDLNTLNLTGSSQSLLTSSIDSQQNPNPSPYISSPAVFADFNGDGNQDKFWRNTQTGENAIWLMDGSNPTGAAVNSLGTEWDYSIGDFNGDGKTDLMWRNQNSGENLLWLMDGSQIVSETSLDTLGSEWDYSIADFNGDSKTDLLWR